MFDVVRIEEIIREGIAEQIFPGSVFGYCEPDIEPLVLPFGHTTYEQTGRMTESHVFDVASVTKVIPTSTLALILLDKEILNLNDRVCSYVPELQFEGACTITIHQLLTHTIEWDFRLSALKNKPAAEILETIYTTPLRRPAGSGFFYSNATSIILGLVIERVANEPLDQLAQRLIFVPLGMNSTTFFPESLPKDTSLVPTEIDPWRDRIICGEVHDESAWKLREIMTAGSAGIFSTAGDICRFLQTIISNGEFDGYCLMSEKMINAISSNQIGNIGQTAGLGWELDQERYMGINAPCLIGKTGFTGCVIMCDITGQRAMTLLSNYTYPTRKPDASGINRIRAALADVVFSR